MQGVEQVGIQGRNMDSAESNCDGGLIRDLAKSYLASEATRATTDLYTDPQSR